MALEMTDSEPYTTITVTEYNRLKNTLLSLREKVQRSREYLEKGEQAKALALLKLEEV